MRVMNLALADLRLEKISTLTQATATNKDMPRGAKKIEDPTW